MSGDGFEGEFDGCPRNKLIRRRYTAVRSTIVFYKKRETVESLITLSLPLQSGANFQNIQSPPKLHASWQDPGCGDKSAVDAPTWDVGDGIQITPSVSDAQPTNIFIPSTRGSLPDAVPSQASDSPREPSPAETIPPGSPVESNTSPTAPLSPNNPDTQPADLVTGNVQSSNAPDRQLELPTTTNEAQEVTKVLSSRTPLITYASNGKIYADSTIIVSTILSTNVHQEIATSQRVAQESTMMSRATPSSRYQTTNDSSNKGVVIGGVVAGVLAFLLVGFVGLYLLRTRKQQRNILEAKREDPSGFSIT